MLPSVCKQHLYTACTAAFLPLPPRLPQNGQSKINQAIFGLPCKLRLLLTGTPIQNDLSEFYAMVSRGICAVQ